MQRLVCFLSLWIVLICVTLVGSVPTAQAQSNEAWEVVRLVNDFRASLGLPPLTYNAMLSIPAQQQAEFIGANNLYTHTGVGGSSPQSRANAAGYGGRVSENIVGGTDMTPTQGLIWWQNSPPHYNTITSDYYTEIGAGFATGVYDQNIYTIVVGNPDGTVHTAPVINAAPISAPAFALSDPADDGSVTHVIQDGQALWTLAAYYEVEIDYLYRINNMTAADFVQPGDTIVVRLADGVPTPTPFPTPTPPFEHEVQRGQTLWTVAALHGLSVDELAYLNSISADALVRTGELLIVRLRPGQSPPPTATPQLEHIVLAGQSLWAIAARYNLTLEELQALNELTEASVIQPGDALFIREQDVLEEAPTAEAVSAESTAIVITSTPTIVSQPTETTAATPAPPSTLTPPPTVSAAVAEAAEANAAPTATSAPRVVEQTPVFQNMMLLGIGAVVAGVIGLILVISRGRDPR